MRSWCWAAALVHHWDQPRLVLAALLSVNEINAFDTPIVDAESGSDRRTPGSPCRHGEGLEEMVKGGRKWVWFVNAWKWPRCASCRAGSNRHFRVTCRPPARRGARSLPTASRITHHTRGPRAAAGLAMSMTVQSLIRLPRCRMPPLMRRFQWLSVPEGAAAGRVATFAATWQPPDPSLSRAWLPHIACLHHHTAGHHLNAAAGYHPWPAGRPADSQWLQGGRLHWAPHGLGAFHDGRPLRPLSRSGLPVRPRRAVSLRKRPSRSRLPDVAAACAVVPFACHDVMRHV
jgi:hypothetical protein